MSMTGDIFSFLLFLVAWAWCRCCGFWESTELHPSTVLSCLLREPVLQLVWDYVTGGFCGRDGAVLGGGGLYLHELNRKIVLQWLFPLALLEQ